MQAISKRSAPTILIESYHPEKAPFREKVKGMHQSYLDSDDADKKKIGALIKRIQEVE